MEFGEPVSNVIPFARCPVQPVVIVWPETGGMSVKKVARQAHKGAKTDAWEELICVATSQRGDVFIWGSTDLEALADLLDSAREAVARQLQAAE